MEKLTNIIHVVMKVLNAFWFNRGAVFDGDQLHYIEPPTWNASAVKGFPLTNGEKQDHVWDLVHFKHEHFTRNLSCGKFTYFDLCPHTEYFSSTIPAMIFLFYCNIAGQTK